jgi:hypothetical protein
MPTPTQKFVSMARERGLTVYTRQIGPRGWGSRHPLVYGWRRRFRKHAPLPSDTLIQHITVTHDLGRSERNFKKEMRTVEAIGWDRFKSGVSYNLCIDMVTGSIGLGQAFDAKGTHTVNDKNLKGFSFDQNLVGHALSFIGMPGDELSTKAVRSTARCIAIMMKLGILTTHFDYIGHREFAYKDCPTDAVVERMPEILDLAHQYYKTL